MPCISLHVAGKLSREQKNEINQRLCKLIEILPGKSKKGLMVDISDGHTMYYDGEEKPLCAYADIRLYKQSPHEEKAKFIEAFSLMLKDVAQIEPGNACFNIIEFEYWGGRGNYH